MSALHLFAVLCSEYGDVALQHSQTFDGSYTAKEQKRVAEQC